MNAKKVLKIAGAIGGSIGLLVPLWGAMLQYQQSVQQNLDQNFRSIVENLSSENKENRLASAANMGTFIKKAAFGKGKYYDEAVDILINRLSVEIDYNVANAINGSLEKIYEAKRYKKEYKRVIEKLLTINRNTFIHRAKYKKICRLMLKLDTGKIVPPGINLFAFIGNGFNVVFLYKIMGSAIFTADIKFLF